ncbi:hypothetical protein FAS41_29295 [Pseudomonas nicosulfuronedens]|uniref:Uncharacterized protein n=1 Tax=Pseudomonas nicosulfuronedens TaxID=2571105 RepID=A0A5R9QLL4_9PSED|nr:hypothetical protein [Pseudomonas nicosulfuronedens]TLX70043.1 hypothetical protein FAS41_29295 [Pseudomonas nicosulfuronedens]
MPRLLPEWLWPRLEALSSQQQLDQQKRKQSLHDKVKDATWSDHCEVALEESRRLFDAEQERRRGADNKAGIYLAAITALIPVLASVLPNLWKDGIDKVFASVSLLIFAGALSYLLRAGLWAFSTIRVSGFAQLGPADIAASWDNGNPQQQLTKHLLLSVDFNMEGTNKKVSCIKMTHEFLLRSFVSFAAFLAVQAIWPMAAWSIETFYARLITPLLMCMP